MSNHIIETIGAHGISHSGGPLYSTRLRTPHPGDLIELPADCPYHDEDDFHVDPDKPRIGTICDTDDGRVAFCCERGSVFLCDTGAVSISGGPFWSVPANRVAPALKLGTLYCWNWGNNSPGAGMGVHYQIARPVFRLLSIRFTSR